MTASIAPLRSKKKPLLLGAIFLLGAATVVVTLGAPWLAEAKHADTAEKGPAPAPAARKECKVDADCGLVPDECCPCNEGGAMRAIPKRQKDAYEKQRLKRCAGTMCAQMISQHKSCSQRASCASGTCKLADVPTAGSP